MKTVFVNPEMCIGCRQCEFACAVEHSTGRDLYSAAGEFPIPRTRVHVEPGPRHNTSFPNKCRHCDPAPCQQVCPTGAITRDSTGDVVLVNPAKCIGCAMCAVVCPFDVLTFHPLTGGPGTETPVAVKCDGCVDRLARGDEPACAEVCKAGALVFGELNDLMREGRLRESATVLASSAMSPAASGSPPLLNAWREWGIDSAKVARAAEESTTVPPGSSRTNGHRDNGESGNRSRSGARGPDGSGGSKPSNEGDLP